MNEESARIDSALDALAAEDARIAAPPRLEAAVMREWDRFEAAATRSRRAGLRREARVWTLAAVAAAAILVAAVLLRGPAGAGDETSPVVSASAAPPVGLAGSTGATGPASEPRLPLTDEGGAAPRLRPSAPAPGLPASTDAGFVIVPAPLVDSAALHVVRVRMSRTALATLGVPIGNPEADGLVDVEMLVGDDGVAQSIRRASFVPERVETGGEQ